MRLSSIGKRGGSRASSTSPIVPPSRFMIRTRIPALVLCAMSALLFFACGDESGDPCSDADCVTPTASVCEGDLLLEFSLPGACSNTGQCVYQRIEIECGAGCVDNACLDACNDNECLEPPQAICDGDELVTYMPQGTCDANTGVCDYGEMRADCTVTDEVCVQTDDGALCGFDDGSCRDGVQNGTETDVDCGGENCLPCGLTEDCDEDRDCATGVCSRGECVSEACLDGAMNGTETDVDCGGDCTPCMIGQDCSVGSDCVSEVCDSGVCAEPSCSDGVLNGAESAADCGGPICEGCPNDEECLDHLDCLSGFCSLRRLCADPSCSDNVSNGDESDVDCGGDICDGCGAGFLCDHAADCRSLLCDRGVCVAESCTDGIANGQETDVDCGGAFCDRCSGGRSCLEPIDCESRVCEDGSCSEASCLDGFRNGAESGIDCGGRECPLCGAGETCRSEDDCISGVCEAARCAAARCTDDVQNGTESDVDCGGADCTPCEVSETCTEDDDCLSRICTAGLCAPAATCEDGVQGPGETDVDCGGVDCAPCAIGRMCLFGIDCETTNCVDGICGDFPTCDDGVTNGLESWIDCGGPDCAPCEVGDACRRAADCVSAVCVLGFCEETTCDDGIAGLGETDVDCGGPCEACDDGLGCRVAEDCTSGVCDEGECQEPTCEDGVYNGLETGVDCGGLCGSVGCLVECVDIPFYDLNDAESEGVWLITEATTTDGDVGFEVPDGCSEGAAVGAPQAVFRFVAPRTGDYNFATDGAGSATDFDTVVYALSEGCDPASASIDCHDDISEGDDRSSLTVRLTERQLVFVIADSFGAAGGTVSMSVRDVTPVTCDNGRRDGDEVDVDCGGSDCGACADGAACTGPADCESRVCREDVCAEPTCEDGEVNGDELTRDCGGSCPGDPLACVEECPPIVVDLDLNVQLGGDFGSFSSRVGTDGGRFNPPLECSREESGYEIALRWVSPLDGDVEFAVDGDFSPVLYLIARRCEPAGDLVGCVEESEAFPGTASLVAGVEAGVTYFLFLDTVEPVGGISYTLTVSVAD